MIEAPVMKADAGTQTDTHFIESNIVKSYEWNEWELRRKAIKLVSRATDIFHHTHQLSRRDQFWCKALLATQASYTVGLDCS